MKKICIFSVDCYSCIDEDKIDSSNCDSDNSTVTCEKNQVFALLDFHVLYYHNEQGV